MARKSAGILLFKKINSEVHILLVHPGGPFWAKKDLNSWSVPKGEFSEDENPIDAAKREFEEETGIPLSGEFLELSPVRQKSGKIVYCYAREGDVDTANVKSNTFEIEWPPKSGKKQSFPEIDKCEWFDIETARSRILESQVAFIDELMTKIV